MKPMPHTGATQRQVALANTIEYFSKMDMALRIVMEAERQNMPVSVLLAIIDQETGFKNVYGHDAVRNPIKSPPGGLRVVTRSNYFAYKKFRQMGLGAQGVGPTQLTYPGYQDEADRDGGCWDQAVNIATGARILAEHRLHTANWYQVYQLFNAGNLTTPQGVTYANQVQALQHAWHMRIS